MRFGASGSKMGSRNQEQNREGGKAQSGQYTVGWVGLLQGLPLTQVNLTIKIVIIIVLKPDSEIDSRLGLINQSQVTVQVDN
jgi:hypothetical protein